MIPRNGILVILSKSVLVSNVSSINYIINKNKSGINNPNNKAIK